MLVLHTRNLTTKTCLLVLHTRNLTTKTYLLVLHTRYLFKELTFINEPHSKLEEKVSIYVAVINGRYAVLECSDLLAIMVMFT